MRLKWKIITACTFLVGIGLGMLVAVGILFYFRFNAVAASSSEISPREKIEQTILADDDLKASVEKLADIPEIREILTDSDIMEAIEGKDYLALFRNKKFLKAARHPAMKELTAKLMKKQLGNFFNPAQKNSTDEETPSDKMHESPEE